MCDLDIQDICADILSMRKYESVMFTILNSPQNAWVHINQLPSFQLASNFDLSVDIYATWLYLPIDSMSYCLVVFCDEYGCICLSGTYNRARLLSEEGVSAEASNDANF